MRKNTEKKHGNLKEDRSFSITAEERIQLIKILNTEDKPLAKAPRTLTKVSQEINLYIPEKWQWRI